MQQIVGVKFRNTAKIYYFAPAPGEEYSRGETVIVETSKGVEYGTVIIPAKSVPDEELTAELKPVLRRANEKDLERIRNNEARRPEAMRICREQIEKHKLDMKLIDCEFTPDGNKAVFYFSAPTRVDFRELVRDLAGEFHLRIELRQVGIRDETRILGGIAPCGRPCCCSCGLSDFKKVTIKMAKTQGLSLNPGKISGLCGRLMCCLDYENDYYASVCKQMPKIGAEVISPDGRGSVVSVNMLKMEVKVKIETGEGGMSYKDFPVSALQIKRNGRFEKDGVPVEEPVEDAIDGEEEMKEFSGEPSAPAAGARPENQRSAAGEGERPFRRERGGHGSADRRGGEGKNRRDRGAGGGRQADAASSPQGGRERRRNRFDRNRGGSDRGNREGRERENTVGGSKNERKDGGERPMARERRDEGAPARTEE